MNSYRKTPLKEICGVKIIKIKDFSEERLLDEEDMPISKENFLMVVLENGFKIAIRPSGTEPKIKFYIFGESLPNPTNLSETKDNVVTEVDKLGSFLVDDAHQRAN